MAEENFTEKKSKTKPRPRGAKSGRSRDFSSLKSNSKHCFLQSPLDDEDKCSEENSTRSDIVLKNARARNFPDERLESSENYDDYSWVKISYGSTPDEQSSKKLNREGKNTFVSEDDICCPSTISLQLNVKKHAGQDQEKTKTFTDVDSIRKNEQQTIEGFAISNYGNNTCNKQKKSGNHEVHRHHRTSSQTATKSGVNVAWQLDPKYTLSNDFFKQSMRDDSRTKLEDKKLTPRAPFVKSNSEGLPTILAARKQSENDFPSKNCWFPSNQSKMVFSGKTCKAKLPSCFPGIVNPSLSSDELNEYEQQTASTKCVTDQTIGKPEWSDRDRLQVPGTSSDDAPGSQKTSLQRPKKISCSTEHTAARIVEELDRAFVETLGDVSDERRNCITPTLMPTRYSITPSRHGRSTSPISGELTSVSSFPHSHSMPNLRDHQMPTVTKRVFVTFEENRPHAKAVDLHSETEIAEKCRNLDLTMDSLGIRALKEKKIAKKTLIREWMQACENYFPSTQSFVSGNRCYACRTHKNEKTTE